MADQVKQHLDGAMRMFRVAEVQCDELNERTVQLKAPPAALRDLDVVWEKYMLWLVCVRQVAVSVGNAGTAAGSPTHFQHWWDGLQHDPTHAFFRQERNDVLKAVAETIEICKTTDGLGTSLAYWVFRRGPREGRPLVPVCQQYDEWLYHSLWAQACQLLHPAPVA